MPIKHKVLHAATSKMPKAPTVGKRTSWKYGKGTYTGVVTRVTKDYVYARTTNGLEKKIVRHKPKGKTK